MTSIAPKSVDLNADLGEGCAWDEPLLDRVTSASVSCGAHAGNPETILATLRLARKRGVIVGAHPGFADRDNFGRREQEITSAEVHDLISNQLATLARLAAEAGVSLRFLKPHGALYNQAQRDVEIARGVISAALASDLPVLGLPGGVVEKLAHEHGVIFITEGFADRRYTDDGKLVPRSDPHAVLEDPAMIARQAIALVNRGIATLCLHGDNPHSVAVGDCVIAALREHHVSIRGFLG